MGPAIPKGPAAKDSTISTLVTSTAIKLNIPAGIRSSMTAMVLQFNSLLGGTHTDYFNLGEFLHAHGAVYLTEAALFKAAPR